MDNWPSYIFLPGEDIPPGPLGSLRPGLVWTAFFAGIIPNAPWLAPLGPSYGILSRGLSPQTPLGSIRPGVHMAVFLGKYPPLPPGLAPLPPWAIVWFSWTRTP
jgi:hypothetical protein